MRHTPEHSPAPQSPVVLLDLDGTLLDSLTTVQDTLLYAADQIGRPHPSPEFLATVAGPPMRTTMARLGWSPQEIDEAMRHYIHHYDTKMWFKAPVFADIPDTLQALRDKGYQLMVATSKRETVAENSLTHVGIRHFIDYVGGAADDGVTRQTKREVVASVIAECGDDPSASPQEWSHRYVMVGDRIHDVEGAGYYGIRTILCTWGAGTPEEWAAAAATASSGPELVSEIIREFSISHID